MKTKIFIPIVLTVNMLLAQSFEQKNILVIDDTNQYNVEEFLHVYNKNRDLAEKVDPKTVGEYMDLFVDFKLKVLDAKHQNMHLDRTFIAEYDGYKYQISKNYLTDSSAENDILREAHERMKKQVRASHILIRVNENAEPKDTLAAYSKIESVLEALKNEPFEKVAVQFSEDPSVQQNKGDLNYFSALQMVYPFENAAYNTKVGEYSTPVRTQFGYHILKVTDKRDNPGERQVAHIMLKTSEGKDLVGQQKKIEEIYAKLEKGEKFSDLVATYSEDKQSATKGGIIRWFGTGKMAKPFEEASFGIKKVNDYSKPFQTKFGWHIVQLVGVRHVSDFETEKPYIKRKITKNDRADIANTAFINKLKKEYNFTLFTDNAQSIGQLMRNIDFATLNKADLVKRTDLNKPVFTFKDQVYTQLDYLKDIKKHEKEFSSNPNQSQFLFELLTKSAKDKMVEYEKSILEEKYPEYRLLLQEYHDGMLLYEISKSKVWDMASTDTLGLQAYHAKHAEKYMHGQRVEAKVYEIASKKLAKQAQKLLKAGKSNEEIEAMLNKTSNLNFNHSDGTFAKGDNKIVDEVKWVKGFSKIVKKGTGYAFVSITNILSPSQKTLKEAKGLVISDYQKELEKNWITRLKKEHKINVDSTILEEVKKQVK